MKRLIKEYRQTLDALKIRREELGRQLLQDGRRAAMLDAEIEEMSEVLYWLREYDK